MKHKLSTKPQCVHKTEKESDKGNGRCTRCAMPTMPFNHIRFWSPFMDSARFTTMVASPRNVEIIEAFLKAPVSVLTQTLVAA